MDHVLHILLIEDDPAHAELILRAFEDAKSKSNLAVAGSLSEAKDILKKSRPDLIIADWRLPDGDSSELLHTPQDSSPPIIIMTSFGNERKAVDVIKSGALDYIVKSSESMIDMPHIVERALEQWNTRQEKERIQNQLFESESQFRLLAENSLDIISRHDIEGKILYVSPACQTIESLIHPEDMTELIEQISRLDWKDITVTVNYRIRHKNGHYIWIESTARLYFDEQRNHQEFQASSRNITERKEAEEALRLAHTDLQEAYDKTIEGWVRALDLRDRETEGHTQRVTQLSEILARAMGRPEEEIVHIRRGALLHDMGKMGIPDEILQKPGPLTDDEWIIMKRHPEMAYQMLAKIKYLEEAIIIPYYHHERWDGSGYPHKLKGEKIPLHARLFAVVDVWDALSSDRPYRKKMPPQDVIEYIKKESGRLFDPAIVDTFLPLIQTFS